MWYELLSRDIGRSAVVFDEAEPRRILAFGISAAVSQTHYDNILRDRAPFIARSLFDEWLSARMPFLDEHRYARENAFGGLNIFVLHNGISETVNGLDLTNTL